jgi:hypothetical protein
MHSPTRTGPRALYRSLAHHPTPPPATSSRTHPLTLTPAWYIAHFLTGSLAHTHYIAHLPTIPLYRHLHLHESAEVCELDLLYGFNKVYALVDEMFLAGEIQDTAPRQVLTRLQMLTTVD